MPHYQFGHGYYTKAGKPARGSCGHPARKPLTERTRAEFLANVWLKWRSDQRAGRLCRREFSRAAIERLEEAQPAWRTYADLLDRQTIRSHDTRSVRREILYALFIQGRHPADVPATTIIEVEPEAIAA